MSVSLPLRAVRAYTMHSPIARGKRWLIDFALDHSPLPREAVLARATDGRLFTVKLQDRMFALLFFLGDYEPEVSAIVRRILRVGDVVVDVGANFGWYTTLFADLVGPAGQVHAFEPVPWIYEELMQNLQLNGSPTWIAANQLALSNKDEMVTLHVFAGLTQGHSSLSDLGRDDVTTFDCLATTLDGYLRQRGGGRPALIKVDVEGAEMHVLDGARGILADPEPPQVIIEMNDETASWFGYQPPDLLSLLQDYGYRFYAMRRGGLWPLPSLEKYRHGDNMLCVVPDLHGDRIARALEP